MANLKSLLMRGGLSFSPETLRYTFREELNTESLCDYCGMKPARYFWHEHDKFGFDRHSHLGNFCSDRCHLASGPRIVKK
jgi:hypothetical protein